MPILSKKKFALPSKKNTKPTFKSPINYKENISKLLNNNVVTSKKQTLPRDERNKKSIKKTLSISISFESNSEVKSKTSQATPNDTFNSSSQLDDSDVDSILSKEILNRKEIKEKYIEFWNENLTPEMENEFKELSQQLNKKRKAVENNPKKETAKKENPKKITKEKVLKDDWYKKMCLIQESRNVGLYVLCDSCDKQRYLPDIKDPLDLPEKWFCWMNPDTKHNTCEAKEVVIDAEEEEFLIRNLFNAGSIVWAKMDGYPWWPAMVDDDPDTEDYFWLEDTLEPTYYHVTFFDSLQVTRAWMKPCDLKPFARNVDNPMLMASKFDNFKQRVDAAVKQAKDAVKLPLIERLRKYSFIHRYKKPLRKVNHEKKGRKTTKNDDKGGELQVKKRKMVNKISSEEEDLQNSNINEILENNLNFQKQDHINFNSFFSS